MNEHQQLALGAWIALFDGAPLSVHHLHCHACGKQVSTGFFPLPTATPDRGLIVRAYIECPECIEEEKKRDDDAPTTRV